MHISLNSDVTWESNVKRLTMLPCSCTSAVTPLLCGPLSSARESLVQHIRRMFLMSLAVCSQCQDFSALSFTFPGSVAKDSKTATDRAGECYVTVHIKLLYLYGSFCGFFLNRIGGLLSWNKKWNQQGIVVGNLGVFPVKPSAINLKRLRLIINLNLLDYCRVNSLSPTLTTEQNGTMKVQWKLKDMNHQR